MTFLLKVVHFRFSAILGVSDAARERPSTWRLDASSNEGLRQMLGIVYQFTD